MAIRLSLKSNGSEVKSDGKDGTIDIISYSHGATAPVDADDGTTGHAAHSPVTITKRLDKASPLIIKALTMSEPIEAEFKFTRPSLGKKGPDELIYTVKLENGRVSSVNQSGAGDSDADPTEAVGLSYEKITWTWTDGGVSHTDLWAEGEQPG
jgi:type VI secretion system secreted protein Hcp